jgi:hypothetical protein
MQAELAARCAEDGIDPAEVSFARAGDLRYVGQGYELRVPIGEGVVDEAAMAQVWEAFHAIHAAEYGHAFRESPIEMVNLRVTAVANLHKLSALPAPCGGAWRRRCCHAGFGVPRGGGVAEPADRGLSPRCPAGGGAHIRPRHPAAEGQHHRCPARLDRPRPSHRKPDPDQGDPSMSRIDPVTAAVIQGALETIAIEMGHKLMRMSYSSIIRESEDFGAALTDAEGQQMCECKMSTPLQSGPIPGYVRNVLSVMAQRGDTVAPAMSSCTTTPMAGRAMGRMWRFWCRCFWRRADRLVGDHGASSGYRRAVSPGSCGIVDAVDTYAEGLQFKAIKVYDRGLRNDAVWHILRANIRAEPSWWAIWRRRSRAPGSARPGFWTS